ncbi:MAG TPA: VWA domain-containing protein, partial [Pirellulales bacterium]|nr:VWA domain-containing protein [Pirellulales bacterium]
GLVALAGPRFGTQYEEVVPRGSDLYVLIDVSRSMLADDVPPTRLGRAKADVAALLNRLEGERVGLIAFAGQAVVKCPLTVDYDAFRRSLDELDTASAPRGGTAIGDAIRKALEVFHARAERDQAILLITDGDDQQSYPLEAAAAAAERHVTIFTVGLGDSDRGARVPQSAGSASYLEYQGQQVWSKMDGSLLGQIALATSGVYVPAGTRAYDLGELYTDYLQGRRGAEGENQKRIRRSEQFQWFLALALAALLADLAARPYRTTAPTGPTYLAHASAAGPTPQLGSRRARTMAGALVLAVWLAAQGVVQAGTAKDQDAAQAPNAASEGEGESPLRQAEAAAPNAAGGARPEKAMGEGLRHYARDEFDRAREQFAAAGEEFAKRNASAAAFAAFDEACACHRNGDRDRAREQYLKAGLSHDRQLAAAAHFNLGTLSAEQARELAGEQPEDVAIEKRQEILDHLASAVASFRHCLELQRDNARARRDIELVRQWIRYYTEKWREHDRRKRREESNLVASLEFLIGVQTALRQTADALPSTAPADAYAELKRAQMELHEEIAPLKDKIRADLGQQSTGGAAAGQAPDEGLEKGIALLEEWADAAGQRMTSAADELDARQRAAAVEQQQSAIDELEKIWDAVIPFHALLARDLADQTQIAGALRPDEPASETPSDESPGDDARPADEADEDQSEAHQQSGALPAAAGKATLASEGDGVAKMAESQERTARRTQLLRLKAQAELERLEKAPQAPAASEENGETPADSEATNEPGAGTTDAQPPIDPEKIKEGYRKAIELAPQAVDQMQSAVKTLKLKEAKTAFPHAEEARKILEEIQEAQPKSDRRQNQDQDKKDQDQNEQEKNEQDQEQQKQNDEKKDEGKNEQNKPDEKKQDESKDSRQKPSPDRKQPQPQVSQDRIEEALRKVRERQQEKRQRDRKLKARLLGRVPVDKDW